MPFHCDDPRTNGWAMETLDELYPMGVDKSNSLVELVPTVSLFRKNMGPTTDDFVLPDYKLGTGGASRLPSWSTDPRLQFQHLTVEMLHWQNSVYKLKIPPEKDLLAAGYNHAWLFNPPIVDCPRMLENMLQEVKKNAFDVDVENGYEYSSMEEILDHAKSMECDGVVNCTGLGAKALCDDDDLIGARGILLHYDRNTCARLPSIEYSDGTDANILVEDGPWGSEEMPCYMIARGETLVVGGSYLEGDAEPRLREEERQSLLDNATTLGIDTRKTSPVGEWTGFRPYRRTCRLEVDEKTSQNDIRVVHSYGYGGSGWTIYTGAAKEATELMLSDR